MHEDAGEASDTVLPPVINQLLGLAWIALFAGRWIVVQLLLAARVLSSTMVADLDDRILIRLYLILLAVTVMVVVLRAMRGAKPNPATNIGVSAVSEGAPPERASTVSLHAADRSPNTGD